MNKILGAFLFILLCPAFAQGQVSVTLSPVARQQFFNASGQPLAGGLVYTYLAGTSTPTPTYADASGTTQNTNPIVLDAGGFATIWLANLKYKFVLFDMSMTQQWTVDNVSSFNGGAQNVQLACAASDPSAVNGEIACRSDLGKMRFFFNTWDSVVTEADTATITNKTITLDSNNVNCTANTAGQVARNNGANLVCGAIQNSDLPTNIQTQLITSPFPNWPTGGTFANTLVKLTGAPSSVVQILTTDTSGIIGVCVSGCGTTGIAQISMNGFVSCTFDGTTFAGDYVIASSTVAGDCHDSSTFSTSSQIVGRVLSTNGAGTWQIYFYQPSGQLPGAGIVTYTGNLTLDAGIGTVYVPFGGGSVNSSTETDVQMQAPVSATVSALRVYVNTVPGVGKRLIVTLDDNGTPTSVTCSVTGVGAQQCSDLTHTFTPAAGDLLDWSVNSNVIGSTTPNVQISAAW